MLAKKPVVLQNFADATQLEWLETNGLGGWASSSVIGTNTRRYHGLLVAAPGSLAERMVLLAKLDEAVVRGEKRFELGSNLYLDNVIAPEGYHYLNNFSKELFPQWEFHCEDVTLKKSIVAVNGENTTLVIYEVLSSQQPFTLELLPLVAGRNYHSLAHEGPQMHWAVEFENGVFHNQPDGSQHLFISVPGAQFEYQPQWYHHFQYIAEQNRGLDYAEDLFSHGRFSIELKEGDSFGVIISTENPADRNAQDLFSKELMRRKLLVSSQPDDELLQQLTLAADQFIIKKSDDSRAIIAGYHWFAEWSRDTMVALPGLCLGTGRFEEAKKILSAFAKAVNMGMLPNRLPVDSESAEYNQVDGTLWYFIAVYKYLQVTGDSSFVLNEILPVLKEIIDWHFRGTRYNIHADENDGLLYEGEEGQQLTWMDVRIGDWVVTPRMGKPVEVQALWYNALRIFSDLLQLNGQEQDADMVMVSAEKVKTNFEKLFWYAEGNYLFDNIDQNGNPSTEFRPNQLFAISLPFPLIEGEKAKTVVQMVEEQLYTPVGLRTLPNTDMHYAPNYGGDPYQRDSAYHEGTVWSWLLGPYIDAVVRTGGSFDKARGILDRFSDHLNEGCIGSVSEIFDAEAPHHPGGCIAQAWSVAELLRVMKEHQLLHIKMELAQPRLEPAGA